MNSEYDVYVLIRSENRHDLSPDNLYSCGIIPANKIKKIDKENYHFKIESVVKDGNDVRKLNLVAFYEVINIDESVIPHKLIIRKLGEMRCN